MEEGKKMPALCGSHVTEENLSICMTSVPDFPLLSDEKFDFDLSLSSTSGNEDEVFVGPVGHKERCIAASMETKKSVSAFDNKFTWSPLPEEKFVEIFKEAHFLAQQIETGSKNEETKISQSEEQENKTIETFVEDSKSKLKILRNQNIEKSPRAVKRETYSVQDSPACQLPPCFQKASDKLSSDGKTQELPMTPSRSPVKICVSPTKIANLPLTQEQKSKETNTKATGRLPMAKPSSTLGRSNLLTIEKPGLRRMTHLKLPGVVSGLTRNSSSSSSVSSVNSSLNSSLPISPIVKKGKSNVPSKAGSKLSSNMSRLALVRPTTVSSLQAANSEKSRKQERSASTPKISRAITLPKSSSSATSEAAGSGIQRPSSVSSLQQLYQQKKGGNETKGSLCPKPKARVLSVSTSQIKVPVKTQDATPNKLAPKATPSLGLTFFGTPGSAVTVSTPMKASEDNVFQNFCFPERSVSMTPTSLKASGLPTPVRRISGFPAVTPKAVPRMSLYPHPASLQRSSSLSTKKTLTAGSKQKQESKTQISSSEDDVSPPPVLPLALNFSPEKAATEGVENEFKEAEVQNQLDEEKQPEALLVDIGVDRCLQKTFECENRPLIDLSNTPEMSKITSPKPVFSGQIKLIDLSSPLITLSPDVNKENLDSPLLKF